MSTGETRPETLRCSFCGKSQHDVAKLVKSGAACICDDCVWLCLCILVKPQRWKDWLFEEVIAFMRSWFETAKAVASDAEERLRPARQESPGDDARVQPEPQKDPVSADGAKAETLYCSFCGTSQYEVAKLIAGPTIFICDDCVWIGMEILADLPDDIPPEFYDDVVAFMRDGGPAATVEDDGAG